MAESSFLLKLLVFGTDSCKEPLYFVKTVAVLVLVTFVPCYGEELLVDVQCKISYH